MRLLNLKMLVIALTISIVFAFLYAVEAFLGIISHPSSDELLSFYADNKENLNTVVSMIKEDQVSSVVDTWNISENQMTAERWNSYRRAFSEMEGVHGVIRYENGYFIEIAHSKSGGSAKGLAYSESNDLAAKPCCLAFFSLLSEEGIAYQKISDEWYIYYVVMAE